MKKDEKNDMLEVRIKFWDILDKDIHGELDLNKDRIFQANGRIIIPKQKIGDTEIKPSAIFFYGMDEINEKLLSVLKKSKVKLLEIKG